MPPAAVPISAVGPVAAATMVFRENGQLRVAAIVKATFAFVHHGGMRVASPEPIHAKEAHRMNNPTRSIVATSDLVPRLPGADVLLVGQAHAPGGGAARVTVRLAIGRGETTILDKRVHVFGDRKGAEIKPFTSMPLVYEKAYGGPGYRDNPLGTGALTGDSPPNVVDPFANDRVAGFGPISRTWPARSSLASQEVRAALDKAIAEIPPGFDFRYFHAAPPDQRIGQIVGDEWIVLEGVHAELPHVRLQLPGAMAMVRVVGTESDGRVFSLRADTLRIDADAERCTIVWRNSFPVRDADLPVVRLLAGVALPDAPIAWPEHVEATGEGATQRIPALDAMRKAAQGASGTMVIDDAAPRLSGTFSGTMEIADDELLPVDDAPDFSSTTVLGSTVIPPTQPFPSAFQQSVSVKAAPAQAVSKEAERAPGAAPAATRRSHEADAKGGTLDLSDKPPAARRARDAKESTLDLSDNFAAVGQAILPFAGRGAPEALSDSARPSGPIPGSPWDHGARDSHPLDEASTMDAEATDLSSTMASSRGSEPAAVSPRRGASVSQLPPSTLPADQVGLGTFEPPRQVEIRTRSEPPPHAAEPAEPAADPWGSALREVPAPVPPAPKAEAPKADSAPGLRSTLYKRFKK